MFEPSRSGVYWLETAPRGKGPSPRLPARSSVVVIGGGATGISAALHLARAGVQVTLLERRTIGSGASCRNGGLFVTGWLHPFARMGQRLGCDGARDLWQFTRRGWTLVRDLIRAHRIDCDWREEGAVFLAATEEEIAEAEESAQGLAAAGLPGELLDPAGLERRTGVAPAPGTRGAIFVPEAASFHPAKLLFPLARAAAEAGASLIEGVEVRAVEVPRFGEARIQTSLGSVEAEVVIVATNGWTSGLLPELSAQITGQREHVVASAPILPRFRGVGWAAEDVHYYWQQRSGGELIIGGSHWDPWKDRRPQSDETVVPQVADDLAEYLAGRYSGVPVLSLTHRWIGTMGITCDGLPLIGRLPGRQQILLSVGYNGHGNPLTYLCGRLLSEAITGGAGLLDVPDFFRPGRFLE